MTMREVDWRIRSILDRRNMSMKYEAALHGKEIKAPQHTKKKEKVEVKLDEKQLKALEKAQKEAQERLRKRHGRR